MAKKNKSGFSLRKLIYNDKYLIIISVIVAVVIWCVTSINLSPETTKTITVPVSVDFSNTAASQLGIKCYGDQLLNVDVTVSCKKYLAKDITADDVNVVLQTASVTSTGNYDVPIKVEALNDNLTIQNYYPNTYRAYFDIEDEKVLDVNVDFLNDDFIAQGYIMGDAILSEKSVTVTGPKSYISLVDKVVASVNIEDQLKKTTSYDLSLNAVDSYGVAVSYVKCVSKNDTINLTIPVLKETTLDVTSSFTGKPSKLNENDFTVKYSVNTVKAGVLEEAGISQANLGNIDFSSLNVGNNQFKFNTSSYDSFKVIDDVEEITVNVVVPDTYSSSSLRVDKSNVEIINIPDGYKAELVSLGTYSVTAVGSSDYISDISSSDIKLIVDLSQSDIKEGSAVYNITTNLNNDYCWIYGKYTATVRIYQ